MARGMPSDAHVSSLSSSCRVVCTARRSLWSVTLNNSLSHAAAAALAVPVYRLAHTSLAV
jgi:hypothetical protein